MDKIKLSYIGSFIPPDYKKEDFFRVEVIASRKKEHASLSLQETQVLVSKAFKKYLHDLAPAAPQTEKSITDIRIIDTSSIDGAPAKRLVKLFHHHTLLKSFQIPELLQEETPATGTVRLQQAEILVPDRYLVTRAFLYIYNRCLKLLRALTFRLPPNPQLTFKLFAQLLNDASLRGMNFAQSKWWEQRNTITTKIIRLLEEYGSSPEEKALAQKLAQCQKWLLEAEHDPDRKYYGGIGNYLSADDLAEVKKERQKQIAATIQALKVHESCLIPLNASPEGLCEIECTGENQYTVRIINPADSQRLVVEYQKVDFLTFKSQLNSLLSEKARDLSQGLHTPAVIRALPKELAEPLEEPLSLQMRTMALFFRLHHDDRSLARLNLKLLYGEVMQFYQTASLNDRDNWTLLQHGVDRLAAEIADALDRRLLLSSEVAHLLPQIEALRKALQTAQARREKLIALPNKAIKGSPTFSEIQAEVYPAVATQAELQAAPRPRRLYNPQLFETVDLKGLGDAGHCTQTLSAALKHVQALYGDGRNTESLKAIEPFVTQLFLELSVSKPQQNSLWRELSPDALKSCLQAISKLNIYLFDARLKLRAPHPAPPRLYIAMGAAAAVMDELARRSPDTGLQRYYMPFEWLFQQLLADPLFRLNDAALAEKFSAVVDYFRWFRSSDQKQFRWLQPFTPEIHSGTFAINDRLPITKYYQALAAKIPAHTPLRYQPTASTRASIAQAYFDITEPGTFLKEQERQRMTELMCDDGSDPRHLMPEGDARLKTQFALMQTLLCPTSWQTLQANPLTRTRAWRDSEAYLSYQPTPRLTPPSGLVNRLLDAIEEVSDAPRYTLNFALYSSAQKSHSSDLFLDNQHLSFQAQGATLNSELLENVIFRGSEMGAHHSYLQNLNRAAAATTASSDQQNLMFQTFRDSESAKAYALATERQMIQTDRTRLLETIGFFTEHADLLQDPQHQRLFEMNLFGRRALAPATALDQASAKEKLHSLRMQIAITGNLITTGWAFSLHSELKRWKDLFEAFSTILKNLKRNPAETAVVKLSPVSTFIPLDWDYRLKQEYRQNPRCLSALTPLIQRAYQDAVRAGKRSSAVSFLLLGLKVQQFLANEPDSAELAQLRAIDFRKILREQYQAAKPLQRRAWAMGLLAAYHNPRNLGHAELTEILHSWVALNTLPPEEGEDPLTLATARTVAEQYRPLLWQQLNDPTQTNWRNSTLNALMHAWYPQEGLEPQWSCKEGSCKNGQILFDLQSGILLKNHQPLTTLPPHILSDPFFKKFFGTEPRLCLKMSIESEMEGAENLRHLYTFETAQGRFRIVERSDTKLIIRKQIGDSDPPHWLEFFPRESENSLLQKTFEKLRSIFKKYLTQRELPYIELLKTLLKSMEQRFTLNWPEAISGAHWWLDLNDRSRLVMMNHRLEPLFEATLRLPKPSSKPQLSDIKDLRPGADPQLRLLSVNVLASPLLQRLSQVSPLGELCCWGSKNIVSKIELPSLGISLTLSAEPIEGQRRWVCTAPADLQGAYLEEIPTEATGTALPHALIFRNRQGSRYLLLPKYAVDSSPFDPEKIIPNGLGSLLKAFYKIFSSTIFAPFENVSPFSPRLNFQKAPHTPLLILPFAPTGDRLVPASIEDQLYLTLYYLYAGRFNLARHHLLHSFKKEKYSEQENALLAMIGGYLFSNSPYTFLSEAVALRCSLRLLLLRHTNALQAATDQQFTASAIWRWNESDYELYLHRLPTLDHLLHLSKEEEQLALAQSAGKLTPRMQERQRLLAATPSVRAPVPVATAQLAKRLVRQKGQKNSPAVVRDFFALYQTARVSHPKSRKFVELRHTLRTTIHPTAVMPFVNSLEAIMQAREENSLAQQLNALPTRADATEEAVKPLLERLQQLVSLMPTRHPACCASDLHAPRDLEMIPATLQGQRAAPIYPLLTPEQAQQFIAVTESNPLQTKAEAQQRLADALQPYAERSPAQAYAAQERVADLNAFLMNYKHRAFQFATSGRLFKSSQAPALQKLLSQRLRETKRTQTSLAQAIDLCYRHQQATTAEQRVGLAFQNSAQQRSAAQIDTLILAYVRGELSEAPRLCTLLHEYMLTTTQAAQIQRAQTALRKALLNPTDITLGELYEQLTAQRCFNPHHHPALLFLEYSADLMIREKQVEIIHAFLKDPCSVRQLRMGEGKTAVILRALALLLGNGRNLVAVMVPKPLYETVLHALQEIMQQYGLPLVEFHPPENQAMSTAYLDDLLKKMRHVQTAKGSLLTTPEDVKTFRNRYLYEFSRYAEDPALQTEEAWHRLETMGAIFELFRTHGQVIGDELHTLLAIRVQTILAARRAQPLQAIEAQAGRTVTQALLTCRKRLKDGLPLYEKVGLLQGREKNLSAEERLEVRDKLVEELIETAIQPPQNFAHMQDLVAYLSRKQLSSALESWLKTLPAQQRDLIGCYAAILAETLTEVLPSVENVIYARSADEVRVIPADKGKPLENSLFRNDFERILYHLFVYARHGVLKTQVHKLVTELIKQAEEESTLSGIAFQKTSAAQRFAQLHPTALSLEQVTVNNLEEIVETIHAHYNASPERRLSYAQFFVLTLPSVHAHAFSSNAHTLVSLFRSFGGFSGTTNPKEQWNRKLDIAHANSKGTDGETIYYLLRDSQTHIHAMHTANLPPDMQDGRQLLNQIVQTHPRYQAILDAAGIGRDCSPEEIRSILNSSPAQPKAVAFFNRDNVLVAQHRGESRTVALAKHKIPSDQRLTYLGIRHCEGVDTLARGEPTNGLVTLSPTMDLDTLLQTVGRLRGIGQGQTAGFLILDWLHKHMQLAPNSKIGVQHLIAMCHAIQTDNHADNTFRSRLMEMEEVVQSEAFNTLLSAKRTEAVSCWKKFDTLLMSSDSRSLFERHGAGTTFEPPLKVLNQRKAKLVETSQQLGLVEASHTLATHAQFKFDKQTALFPKEVPASGPQEIDTRVEVLQQQHTRTRMAAETNVEVDFKSLEGWNFSQRVLWTDTKGLPLAADARAFLTPTALPTAHLKQTDGLFPYVKYTPLSVFSSSRALQTLVHSLSDDLDNLFQPGIFYTENWLRTGIRPFTPLSMPINQVLILQNPQTAKWMVLIGDQLDLENWHKLIAQDRTGIKIGLYDLRTRRCSSTGSANPIADEEIPQAGNGELQAMLMQVRLLSGRTTYNPAEIESLRLWIDLATPERVEEFFTQNVLKSHPQLRADYRSSMLAEILAKASTKKRKAQAVVPPASGIEIKEI